MECNMYKVIREGAAWISALAFASAVLMACSGGDKTAGGSSEDAGIVAVKDLDVAGLAQKGPFVKGSEVTVQGIDCKTMKFTDEEFTGKVKSDKGDFGVDDVNLSASCALFEVSGYYLNEVTGKKSSEKLALHALTDLSDRKSVNINVLTELEYERVMKLVSKEKMSFADAKIQAEKEVLASLGIMDLFESFEGLNIYEKGDGNAMLLATSVLLQSDLDAKDLTDRMAAVASSITETGEWNDEKTKTKMTDWASAAKDDGKFESVRKNLEKWSDSDEIPEFEKVVDDFGADSSAEALKTMTDSRDGQTYMTVKIGEQVWMAENLNFKIDSSYCYKDSSKYCKKYGRLYTWTAAMKACPDGWRLPSETDFVNLIKAVGGEEDAGTKLKSTSGWNDDDGKSGNGTDSFGFSALAAGVGNAGIYGGEGYTTIFWGSTECSENSPQLGVDCAYAINLDYDEVNVNLPSYAARDLVLSVRCVKGKFAASSSSSSAKSSSSSAKSSSSSADADGWSWNVPKEARLNPNIKYDSMVDPRDNQVYKVVKIEVPDSNYSQVWMAENLNYADSVKTPSLKGGNWCYQDNEKNCKVSGRYYSWAAAIDSVALANDPEEPLVCGYGKTCGLDRAVQGICPDGWHLPSIYEWGLLRVAMGPADVAGEPLKALTGWDYAGTPNNNGTDKYGFAALPTGRRISATSWQDVGSNVYYWSAAEYSANYGRYFNINNVYTNAYTNQNSKYYGQSVRCVKGDPSTAPVRPSSSSSVDKAKSSSSSKDVSPQSSDDGASESSSSVASSSSVVSVLSPCKTDSTDSCEYGTLTDDRDGQTYKTVKIGNQEWMAENLNYAYTGVPYKYEDDTSDSTSWCYDDDPANCTKYGRLYTWAAAMDSAGLISTANKTKCGYGTTCTPNLIHQGVCPGGWHIPTVAEWKELFVNVGGTCGDEEYACTNSGAILKSSSGWYDSGNGSDDFGFSVIPSGWYGVNSSINVSLGSVAYYWTAMEYDSSRAYSWYFIFSQSNVKQDGDEKKTGLSVRCVKD